MTTEKNHDIIEPERKKRLKVAVLLVETADKMEEHPPEGEEDA